MPLLSLSTSHAQQLWCLWKQSIKHQSLERERIELELKKHFPTHHIGRMDLDTTRGKYGYQKIIGAFEAEIDILVGTQMLSKVGF